jgi:peptidyl-prolyl cis-trans isomerase C
VDVHALRVRAEAALMELLRKDVPAERFAQMATELSNCPSGAQGGDLGWVGPDDCAPELSNELFHQKNPLRGMGVHPRLIHTRFGFHVIEVLGRRKGKQIELRWCRAGLRTGWLCSCVPRRCATTCRVWPPGLNSTAWSSTHRVRL